MTPSIDIACKLADVFGVAVDSLVSERDRILFVVDGLIRDPQARRAHAAR